MPPARTGQPEERGQGHQPQPWPPGHGHEHRPALVARRSSPAPPGRCRPPADGAGPDQRALVTQAGRLDAGPDGRTRGGPATRSSSAGRLEERLAEAEGHRTGHHGQREVEQVHHRGHGPADQRAAARTTAGGASAGGRPVIAAMAVPDASASRQPRAPQAHSRPSGSTTTWPMWPALPEPAVEQAAVEDDARHPPRSRPPWPGSRGSPGPPPPNPRPGPAPWRRCRRRSAGRSARPAGRGAGSSARRGC